MWSGGQEAIAAGATGAGASPADAVDGAAPPPAQPAEVSDEELQSIAGLAAEEINEIASGGGSADDPNTVQALQGVIRDALSQVPPSQKKGLWAAIEDRLSQEAQDLLGAIGQRAEAARQQAAQASAGGGARRGSSGRQAAGASGGTQGGRRGGDQYQESRVEALENAERQLVQRLQDLRAALYDELPRSEQAQLSQAAADDQKIAEALGQFENARQRYEKLVARSDSEALSAARLRLRFCIDTSMWKFLSVRDILEKVEAAWDEAIHSYIYTLNYMARAEAGVSGQPHKPSGGAGASYAPQMPSYREVVIANDAAEAARHSAEEARIALDGQRNEIEGAQRGLASRRSTLASHVEGQRDTYNEQIGRAGERLADVRERLIKVKGAAPLEEGAATMFS